MSTTTTRDLGIAGRLERPKGREVRSQFISARVTPYEEKELVAAAKQDGKLIAEWMREALFAQARRGGTELAIFTEVVALRKLLTVVLRSVAIGESLTPEAYEQIKSEVRIEKHSIAQDLLTQYKRAAKDV